MLQTLKLLLPALIPSWRFFDVIAPSPRIEIALLKSSQEIPEIWQEFRPRPKYVSFFTMLKRMFWNAHWNESLFLMSCAERLMRNPTQHSSDEIVKRIKLDLLKEQINLQDNPFLQFRLMFIYRDNTQIQSHIAFTSQVYEILGDKYDS